MFRTTGDLLKYTIDKKILTKKDLFTTDREVWAKKRPVANKDNNLKLLLDKADNKFEYKSCNKDNYDLRVFCKSRVANPLFLKDEKLSRVPKVDFNFSKLKEKYLKPKEYYIKFLERGN
jgi:hypothetical protein